MAADYALEATIERAGTRLHGYRAIADYFDNVPERLGSNRLIFSRSSTVGKVSVDARKAVADMVSWTIVDQSGATLATGRDRFTVADGRIVSQVVHLDGDDF